MKYALINSNGETLRVQEFDERPADLPQKGWHWAEYVAPPEPPPAPRTRFSSLEFLERFTEEEQLAVVTATLASPTVKLWYDKLLAAEFVDLNDHRTEGGLDALISAGLLDPSRKAGLLTPT